MTVLDANLLLYAHNSDAPQQRASAAWLKKLFAGGETIGLPWLTLWAFIRVSTNPRIWANPKSAGEVFQIIDEWLAMPGVIVLHPGALHAEILRDLVGKYSATGPLVTDAVLAALAIENGATLASTDRDFRRFPQLRWVNPLDD